jgi:hypothetical protein
MPVNAAAGNPKRPALEPPVGAAVDTPPELSALGGPLHRLGMRLGLVRGDNHTVPLGLAIGALLWIVLLVLGLIEGVAERLFSMSALGVHVRLLLAMPLCFLCESWVSRGMSGFAREIVSAGLVPVSALPAFKAEIERSNRWKDSWVPDVVCALVAGPIGALLPHLGMLGTTGPQDGSGPMELTWTAQWYWGVCLPVFRFLMLRWLWRLGWWCHFLWRVSRLKLRLVPTHPDGVAGLGYLEVVHAEFAPLIVALSALQSASIAEEIHRGSMTFDAAYPALAVVFIIVAVLFIGPLCVFIPRLWACRAQGLADYMSFSSHYVNSFDSKWMQPAPDREPLLGTADLQSLADLQNSIGRVREMRLIPVGQELLTGMLVSATLPMLPLALLQYPITELVGKFFARVSGL